MDWDVQELFGDINITIMRPGDSETSDIIIISREVIS
jgi:hypothetical protein